MTTRWRGVRIYLLSFAVIATLALGRYALGAGPDAAAHLWHGLLDRLT